MFASAMTSIPSGWRWIPSGGKISVAVVVLVAAAGCFEVSGVVLEPDGVPARGLVVRAAGGLDSAVTDDSGRWSLEVAHPRNPASLSIQAGRERFLRGGRRSDTLLYSKDGWLFLRDTVSGGASGMLRIHDETWAPRFVYGWFQDQRDGRIYRSIRIGSRRWMAQNLDFRPPSGERGSCAPSGLDSNRTRYGALYEWPTAMGVGWKDVDSGWNDPVRVHRGICPSGWHVPNDAEWGELRVEIGLPAAFAADRYHGYSAGTSLKSDTFWVSREKAPRGTDRIGFRALPAGMRDDLGFEYCWGCYMDGFHQGPNLGNFASFWSSTTSVQGESGVGSCGLQSYHEGFLCSHIPIRKRAFSLRCVEDPAPPR